MTRPHIIRADTIDLQAHEAKASAQTHHRPTPDGSLAPHQAETLREVAAETAEEKLRSPSAPWTAEPDDIQQHALALDSAVQRHAGSDNMRAASQEDALAIAQNGGLSGHDADADADNADLDGDAEVDMDDDMMDKISSSPSIEDERGAKKGGTKRLYNLLFFLAHFAIIILTEAVDDDESMWEDSSEEDDGRIPPVPPIPLRFAFLGPRWVMRVEDAGHDETQEPDDFRDLILPYEPDDDEDDDGDFPEPFYSRFIDSGWGGECLQETEDIDFDFVYALHTFVATVEGQANASKGDTMVLLDDSNSYWWLVRVVKDSSIAPTYVDYSDIDYSSEEEDDDGNLFAPRRKQSQQVQRSESTDPDMDDETAKVEPLKPRSQPKKQDMTGDDDSSTANKAGARPVDEISEARAEGPKKTSDGTVRDSFFKDDTVETKKITLTPNLLRDDNGPRTSSESREVKQRPSFDRLEKDGLLGRDDKKKKKEKEKEKKGGLRGFFSRKDKKHKGEDDDESFGKRSMDADALEKEAEDEGPQPASPGRGNPSSPQRQPSKLQKQMPRAEISPASKPINPRENGMDVKSFLSEGRVNNVANVPPPSMRLVEASPENSPQAPRRPSREPSPKSAVSTPSRPEPRPAMATPARSRLDLDDFDSDEDITPEPTRQASPLEKAIRSPPQGNPFTANQPTQTAPAPAPAQTPHTAPPPPPPQQPPSRLSESPSNLEEEPEEEDENNTSPLHPSPELIEHADAAPTMAAGPHKTLTTPSTTRSESWDDVSLRAFFDSGSDIVRDLLVVVYDKNDVEEVGLDSPLAGGMFREENARLAEITTRLDHMLGDWLARKQRMRGSV
ncbi:protein phosphatase regulator [Collariella sp. IMI 366227]|nr:protein phosphatase regulator [Collariella sp. IMI 366227]